MRKFLTLSVNTAREVMRQPVVAMITSACIVTIGMLPVAAVFSLGQEARIVRDGAGASCLVYGLFLVAASSIAAIDRQVRSGTAGAILCKPVSREMFFAATFLGIVFACLIFTATAVFAGMVSARMALEGIHTDWAVGSVLAAAFVMAFAAAGVLNYRGRNFCSVLNQALFFSMLAALLAAACLAPGGGLGDFGEFMQWGMLSSGLLIFAALSMLAAIAVALSTRLAPAGVLFFCFFFFALGLVSDYLLAILSGRPALAALCACLLPNWQFFWVHGGAGADGAATAEYVLRASLYAALYTAGVLCLGFISFRRSDV